MKYLFFGIYATIKTIISFIGWVIAQALVIIWHFDLKHTVSYRNFFDLTFKAPYTLTWCIIFLVLTFIMATLGFSSITPLPELFKVGFFMFFALFSMSLLASIHEIIEK
jgi:uncharacterized membrane protein YtjA (UPF0391 family)